MDKILATFQTSEMWLVVVAVVWLLGSRFLGLPGTIDGMMIGIPGQLGPVHLLAIAASRIIPKIATPGETPFVKPEPKEVP